MEDQILQNHVKPELLKPFKLWAHEGGVLMKKKKKKQILKEKSKRTWEVSLRRQRCMNEAEDEVRTEDIKLFSLKFSQNLFQFQ